MLKIRIRNEAGTTFRLDIPSHVQDYLAEDLARSLPEFIESFPTILAAIRKSTDPVGTAFTSPPRAKRPRKKSRKSEKKVPL